MLVRARWLALGALAMYFLDPQSGARRRRVLQDRALAVPRRLRRRLARSARAARAETRAVVARATHLRERPKDLSDATLADKVRSEVFRDPALPKGDVNVNVEEGRVVLRGQVESPELVEELERRVRKVVGVRDVENLLHLPGTEPRHHAAWDR
jgi:osmotically-inducible protein OsmY